MTLRMGRLSFAANSWKANIAKQVQLADLAELAANANFPATTAECEPASPPDIAGNDNFILYVFLVIKENCQLENSLQS